MTSIQGRETMNAKLNHSVVVDFDSAPDIDSPENKRIAARYTMIKAFGQGSFGTVFEATDSSNNNERVAIKKIVQDKRYKSRELQIMKLLKSHPNTVMLKECFATTGSKRDEVYVNLVMEFVPDSVHRVLRHYAKRKLLMPLFLVKLFRAVAYMHTHHVCHRDIKPQNLLLYPENGHLKICDFGRAPELIFGATQYEVSVDVWSAGCVVAEMLMGHPIFPGPTAVDQLVEIFKVLGTPTREEMQSMNKNFASFALPDIKCHPLASVFQKDTSPDAIDLVSKILKYDPRARLTAMQVLLHPFFDDLRDPSNRILPNGQPLPPLFDFTYEELEGDLTLASKLVPEYARDTCPIFSATSIRSTSSSNLKSNQQAQSSSGDAVQSS